jgi:hypothetical protein
MGPAKAGRQVELLMGDRPVPQRGVIGRQVAGAAVFALEGWKGHVGPEAREGKTWPIRSAIATLEQN